MKTNVLRVLDCKEEKCQAVKAEAPQILDHLCDECHSHLKEVLEYLDEIDVPYQLDPFLVRGLDYYTKTVFEFFGDAKEGEAPLALGGGGRYDKLTKLLGGRETPACGAAAGIERIVLLMKEQEIALPKEPEVQIFLAQLGSMAKRKSLKLLDELRRAKIRVSESFGRDSLTAQLGRADRLEVRYSLILGQKEALEDSIIIRDMKNGKQAVVKLEKAVDEIRKRLKK